MNSPISRINKCKIAFLVFLADCLFTILGNFGLLSISISILIPLHDFDKFGPALHFDFDVYPSSRFDFDKCGPALHFNFDVYPSSRFDFDKFGPALHFNFNVYPSSRFDFDKFGPALHFNFNVNPSSRYDFGKFGPPLHFNFNVNPSSRFWEIWACSPFQFQYLGIRGEERKTKIN